MAGHILSKNSGRVAKYSREIARRYGYSEKAQSDIYMMGLLHDVGKIGVADAYDAMSSRRSYRDVLPQETVREEIKKGKGTQFDPQFADIMLAMIEEDTEYKMREE